MELLVCLVVIGQAGYGALGLQQAVSYQNFRASHGQGHPTYGPDGSWSQRFGGPSRGSPFHVSRPFLSLGYYEPPSQPLVQQAYPSSPALAPQDHYSEPLVTSYPEGSPTPVYAEYSPGPQSYPQQGYQQQPYNGEQAYHQQSYDAPLPVGADPTLQTLQPYNEPVASIGPAPELAPSQGPLHNLRVDDRPAADLIERPLTDDRPRFDERPISNPGNGNVSPGFDVNNRPLTGVRNGNERPGFGIDERPLTDLRNSNERPLTGNERPGVGFDEKPLTDVRNGNERPAFGINDRPLTHVRNGNERPGFGFDERPLTDVRKENERPGFGFDERPLTDVGNGNERPGFGLGGRPLTDVRNENGFGFDDRPLTNIRNENERPGFGHDERPLTDVGNVNGRPGFDKRPPSDVRNGNGRPLTEVRYDHRGRPIQDTRHNQRPFTNNNVRPHNNIRNNNNKRPADFRPHNDKSGPRLNINRPLFPSASPTPGFGSGFGKDKFGSQSLTGKFKTPLPSNSPLQQRQHAGANGRSGVGSLDTNLPSSLGKPPGAAKSFNRDEKKPAPNFRQKGEFDSEEDKNQSFESDFQSAEIGGQSFEADIPDFGSDESYFNSQEGYGSFESSAEGVNSQEEKRNNNFKADTPGGGKFPARGAQDGPAEPRANQKSGTEAEARSRSGFEEKKPAAAEEKKKSSFPVTGDKKPLLRTSSTMAPSKDTLPLANKKLPHLTPFRPSQYVPFLPVEKPFSGFPHNQ